MEEKLSLPDRIIRSNNLDTCRGARVQLSPKLRGEEGEAAWQNAVTAPEALVAIDLFFGAGGLSYGFQEAGFVSALGIDSDADVCETHAANLLSRTLRQDIGTIKHPQAVDGGTRYSSCRCYHRRTTLPGLLSGRTVWKGAESEKRG